MHFSVWGLLPWEIFMLVYWVQFPVNQLCPKKLKVVFFFFNLELNKPANSDHAFKKNGSQLDLIYCLLSVKQLLEIFVFGGDSFQSKYFDSCQVWSSYSFLSFQHYFELWYCYYCHNRNVALPDITLPPALLCFIFSQMSVMYALFSHQVTLMSHSLLFQGF